MGDMPIYVGHHSADVWANRSQFLLNRKGYPLLVSGVPPDAFSETGQLWGSKMDFPGGYAECEEQKIFMVSSGLTILEDLLDFGQFRLAREGKSLFDAILRQVGQLDIIAEDLDVVELRKSIGAPGMSILQFGFRGDADNPHLLHNHESNQVAYNGTHDNDTVNS
ncbi:hypothetical protein V2J09_006311 [Rumex salicifolius]